MGREIKYVEDTIGEAAQKSNNLDNLVTIIVFAAFSGVNS